MAGSVTIVSSGRVAAACQSVSPLVVTCSLARRPPMLWPTSTICDRFGSAPRRVVRLTDRGQMAAEHGGAGEER